MTIQLTPMTEHHLDAAWALTQHLRWPHRREDWQQALALGEGLIAEAQGELLGTILFWRWGQHYATIGLVIVAKHAQGNGLGRRLMQAALARLEGYNVRLHATEAGQPLYEKLGFTAHGEMLQHQTPSLPQVAVSDAEPGLQLRDAQHSDADALIALDTQAHGQHRPALMHQLLNNAVRCRVLVHQGNVVGFAAVRRFGHGYVVGPVIAASPSQAKWMISDGLSRLAGQFVRLDSARDEGLTPWLNALGLHTVDAPVLMMRGTPWVSRQYRAVALMTQAMG